MSNQHKPPQPPVYTYWYLLHDHVDMIALQKAGLLPIDMLSKEQQEHYRTPTMSPEEYWRDRYAKFFQPVLHRPYKHYGIYTTPVDLPHSKTHNGPKFRVRFDLSALQPLVVFQQWHITKRLVLATPENVRVSMSAYSPEHVLHIWTTVKTRRFRFLPQIVYFGDVPLKFKADQVEPW